MLNEVRMTQAAKFRRSKAKSIVALRSQNPKQEMRFVRQEIVYRAYLNIS